MTKKNKIRKLTIKKYVLLILKSIALMTLDIFKYIIFGLTFGIPFLAYEYYLRSKEEIILKNRFFLKSKSGNFSILPIKIKKMFRRFNRIVRCACIQDTSSGKIGILHMEYNSNHYLLRSEGDSNKEVMRKLVSQIHQTTNGAVSETTLSCEECKKESCPLKHQHLPQDMNIIENEESGDYKKAA